MPERDSTPLPPEQLSDLIHRIEAFQPHTRERGNLYVAQRRVSGLSYGPGFIEAVVVGNDWYDVSWRWSKEEGWTGDCSCPVAVQCKHAYATARAVISRHHLPDRERVAKGAAPAAPPALPAELARRLAMLDAWGRRVTIQRLLAQPRFRHVSAYDPRVEEIVEEEDVEVLCWRLARHVVDAAGDVPPELAPYLDQPEIAQRVAVRESQQLSRGLLQWISAKKKPARRTLRFVWGFEASQGRGYWMTVEGRLTSQRMQDEPRTYEQLRNLYAEAQRNSGTLPVEQEALLSSFFDALIRHPVRFAGIASTVSPAVAIAMLKSGELSPELMTWSLTLPDGICERGGIAPGAPLRYDPRPVRVLPAAVPIQSGARVELHAIWQDGSERALRDLVYFPGGTYHQGAATILADGALFQVVEEPPSELRDRFLHFGGLEVARQDCVEVVAPLAAHFEHVRQALREHTRIVPGRLVAALDLREDDWLQIRVFSAEHAGDWLPHEPVPPHAVVFELTPESRWRRLAADQPRPAGETAEAASESYGAIVTAETSPTSAVANELADDDVWLESPDPQLAQPLLDWLHATGAEPQGPLAKRRADAQLRWQRGLTRAQQPPALQPEHGWWVRATARRMATFAELWEQRPEGVTFYGTERVRRLLAEVQHVRPKLDITSTGVDWFSVSAQWQAEGLALSDGDMARLRSATTAFVRLTGGWVRRDAIAAQDEAAEVLADLGIEIGGGEQRITMWQLAGAKAESIAALERLGATPETAKALNKLRQRLKKFSGVPEIPVPAGITADLRPYQRRGLDFLAHTAELGIGAVLADDMGLGKTLQALAWLEHLRAQRATGGPALVVCPTSVMHNWVREAERFAPGIRVLLLQAGEERHQLRKELPEYDLVVTNYALLRRDIQEWREVKLRAAILDEAQNIKNPDAAVSRAAFELQAEHRLALTGTPLENRPLDLWSIMNFVNPGYLGDRSDFGVRFDRIDAPPHARTLLAAKLRPVLLRRLKREVATDLPDRIEERRDCEMTPGQRQLYLSELRRSRRLVDDLSEQPDGLRKNKIVILAALTRLRQICCHPALAGGKADLGSGKFDALFELLEPLLAEGHKVLVFSQFVQCLKLIEAELAGRGIAWHKLTGQTQKRDKVVAAFQSDQRPCVFLISLKAGGTGLNLTAASYVVLFDPWWNPAVEAQAIDRTHRIGQDRTVIAYRMLTRGTIEEKIWDLQQRKQLMVRDILGEDGFARALSRDDLSFLLEEI